MIGDVRSDCCVVAKAQHVFAKGVLREWCQQHAIAHEPFETLTEVAYRLFSTIGSEKGRYAVFP